MLDWLLRLSISRPRTVMGVALVLTAVLVAGLPRLELRTDGEWLRPAGHPAVVRDVLERERFGEPRFILLLARSPRAEGFARAEGLRALRSLGEALERLPVLEGGAIESLASLPAAGAGLQMGNALDAIPDSPDALRRFMAELEGRPGVAGGLLAMDRRSALHALPIRADVSTREAVAALTRFVDGYEADGLTLLLGGPLLAETILGDSVLADLATLVPVMVLMMALILAVIFRSLPGVLIPLIETLVVLLWTAGVMAWAGIPVALVTTILPVVLMAMCISDEIHLLERLQAARVGSPLAESIPVAFEEVGRPIVLTSLTTAAGFLSFLTSSIAPLRHFGALAAFGILLAMGLTFSLIPAMLVSLPTRWLSSPVSPAERRADRGLGRGIARRPGVAFAAGAALLGASLPGLFALRASDAWVDNFPPESDLVQMEELLGRQHAGGYSLDLVLEGEPGRFRSPEGLRWVERVAQVSEGLPGVGGRRSILDPLTEIAAALGASGSLASLGPSALWDLFTAAEMAPAGAGLSRLMTNDASVTRVRLYIRGADYALAQALFGALEARLAPLRSDAAAAGVEISAAGELAVATAMVDTIVRDQLRSVAAAVALVTVLLLVLGGGRWAWVCVLPVSVATLCLLGGMGWAGMPLGIATSMFASLSIGLGVDFGIHFGHAYRRAAEAGAGFEQATLRSFAGCGRAIRWNTMVLAAGFAVLTLSRLAPNHALGLLLASATLLCAGMTFLLMPLVLRTLGGLLHSERRASPARASGKAGAAAGVILLLGLDAGGVRAAGCPTASDPEAMALMRALEEAVRAQALVFRMAIHTEYGLAGGRERTRLAPTDRTLWGVANGDANDTRMLFVFSAPGRMAGTSLLIRDLAGGHGEDQTWFYLRAFDHFEELQGDVERTLVAGTALSYEDARGFIATDRYHFAFAEPSSGKQPQAGLRRIVACPRSEEGARRLGYGALDILIDAKKRIVQEVAFEGIGGAKLKRYRVLESRALGGVHRPVLVRLESFASDFENRIAYEYWEIAAPTGGFFEPAGGEQGFLKRLEALVAQRIPLAGKRLRAELETADARVRAYEERRRQALEGEREKVEEAR